MMAQSGGALGEAALFARRSGTTMSDSGCSSISAIKIFYKIKGDKEDLIYRTQVEDIPLGHAPTLGDFRRARPKFAFYKAYCVAFEETIRKEVRIELDGNSEELVKNANGEFELFLEAPNSYYDEPLDSQAEDEYTTFEETETFHRRQPRFGGFDSMASTSFSTTDASNYHRRPRRQYRAKRPQSEYSTMLTETSLALDMVTINLDIRFRPLGIQVASINGSGLIVANLLPGGAAAVCGQISVGDLILKVNEMPLEAMPDDEAARYLSLAEQHKGFITICIAKTMQQPKQPFFENPYAYYQPIPMNPMPMAAAPFQPQAPLDGPRLNTGTHKFDFLDELEKGLRLKNRRWLKMDFRNTFLGAELVKWLRKNVEDIKTKRQGRKFAQELMEAGIFRHVVSKMPFNENCIYEICNDAIY